MFVYLYINVHIWKDDELFTFDAVIVIHANRAANTRKIDDKAVVM